MKHIAFIGKNSPEKETFLSKYGNICFDFDKDIDCPPAIPKVYIGYDTFRTHNFEDKPKNTLFLYKDSEVEGFFSNSLKLFKPEELYPQMSYKINDGTSKKCLGYFHEKNSEFGVLYFFDGLRLWNTLYYKDIKPEYKPLKFSEINSMYGVDEKYYPFVAYCNRELNKF